MSTESAQAKADSWGLLGRSVALAVVTSSYLGLLWFWCWAPRRGVFDGVSDTSYLLLKLVSGPTSAAMFLEREIERGDGYWTWGLVVVTSVFLGGVGGFLFVRNAVARSVLLAVALLAWVVSGLHLMLYFF